MEYSTNKQTYITKTVTELLSESLADYLPKEKIAGGGATPKQQTGVGELAIPEGISSTEKRTLIQAHLAAKGIDKMHKDYPAEFSKLWNK